MGTRAGISEQEYLHTSFEGLDCEYRDGEIVERGLPDNPHSKTQANLLVFFGFLRNRFPVFLRPELRMKVRPGRYMIPDVAVYWPEEPVIAVPDTPPLIAIEIRSPEERLPRIKQKLDEYRNWGVRHVWLVDPHARRLYTYDGDLVETATFGVPELGVQLTAQDIF
jgi:Uma2 family endonuclease